MAETNRKETSAASTFGLKEKQEFYRKKWLKEHIALMVFLGICIVAIFVVGAVRRNSLLGGLAVLLLVLAHGWRNNTMMAYIEAHVFDVPKEDESTPAP